MADPENAVPEPKELNAAEGALKTTLDREFDDWEITRTRPDPQDRDAIDRYTSAARRIALRQPISAVADSRSSIDVSEANEQALLKRFLSVLTPANKISAELMYPVRIAAGLYDYYPSRIPWPSLRGEPFSVPFTHMRDSPPNSTILITVPQIDTGQFFSSAYTLAAPTSRHAHAWCGTLIGIDPNLHDAAHGPRDVMVWAEGTIGYDYTLTALPGQGWNTHPDAAANANVSVMARLLRFDRSTGQPRVDPDAILAYFAARTILNAKLFPNGQTTSAPSSAMPIVGGSYAAWTSWPMPFQIDLADGKPRMLDTDSTYMVAVLCAVGLSAWSVGGDAALSANASVSGQMFLRLVTLGIVPHDPKVI